MFYKYLSLWRLVVVVFVPVFDGDFTGFFRVGYFPCFDEVIKQYGYCIYIVSGVVRNLLFGDLVYSALPCFVVSEKV